jgi:hypothetical protein
MKPTKCDDETILKSLSDHGGRAMTYVVANRIRSRGFNVRTDWTLRQLKRLEKEGRVKQVPSSYAVQICWRVVA